MTKFLVVLLAVLLVGALASPVAQETDGSAGKQDDVGEVASRVIRSPDPVPDPQGHHRRYGGGGYGGGGYDRGHDRGHDKGHDKGYGKGYGKKHH